MGSRFARPGTFPRRHRSRRAPRMHDSRHVDRRDPGGVDRPLSPPPWSRSRCSPRRAVPPTRAASSGSSFPIPPTVRSTPASGTRPNGRRPSGRTRRGATRWRSTRRSRAAGCRWSSSPTAARAGWEVMPGSPARWRTPATWSSRPSTRAIGAASGGTITPTRRRAGWSSDRTTCRARSTSPPASGGAPHRSIRPASPCSASRPVPTPRWR